MVAKSPVLILQTFIIILLFLIIRIDSKLDLVWEEIIFLEEILNAKIFIFPTCG